MRPIDADELYARLMARYTAHNFDDTRDMAARAAITSCIEAVERSKTITISTPPNDQLTLEQLREMDRPVWVECGATPFTPNGGYYCLCQFGKITAPSGAQFDIEEISHWNFYCRKP